MRLQESNPDPHRPTKTLSTTTTQEIRRRHPEKTIQVEAGIGTHDFLIWFIDSNTEIVP